MGEVRLRPATPADLDFITRLERRPDHCHVIGQWSDAQHLLAIAGFYRRGHTVIERGGERAGYLIDIDCREQVHAVYVKRLLVADKDRGTGSAALAAYIARAFEREGVERIWLNVRAANERAIAVYTRLGFTRFDPPQAQACGYDAAAEAPGDGSFRMVLNRG